MAKLLLAKEVNEKLNARIIAQCEACKARGCLLYTSRCV